MTLHRIISGLIGLLFTIATTAVAQAQTLADAQQQSTARIPQSAPAPDFALSVNGATSLHQLSQQGYVYVDFWASWCGPCRYSFPFMNRLHDELGDSGLTVIAVNVDAIPADAKPFLAEHPANFAIHYDPSGTIGTAFAVRGMPSSFLVKDGKVVLSHVGFRRSEADKLYNEIATIVTATATH